MIDRWQRYRIFYRLTLTCSFIKLKHKPKQLCVILWTTEQACVGIPSGQCKNWIMHFFHLHVSPYGSLTASLPKPSIQSQLSCLTFYGREVVGLPLLSPLLELIERDSSSGWWWWPGYYLIFSSSVWDGLIQLFHDMPCMNPRPVVILTWHWHAFHLVK